MKITMTLHEILMNGDWEEFCRLRCYNEYIMRDGRASGDEEEELTVEEIRQCGLSRHVALTVWPEPVEP